MIRRLDVWLCSPAETRIVDEEFTRYKSIYCGICKQIGHDYGQLPRVGVNCDLTMLAVLLLSSESTTADGRGGRLYSQPVGQAADCQMVSFGALRRSDRLCLVQGGG